MCSDSYPIPILSPLFLYHPYIPYLLINLWCACTAQVTVVAVSVCVSLSIKRHLISAVYVRPIKAATYSEGNVGQKVSGVFSETASLQRLSAPSLGWPYITRMRIVHTQVYRG